MNKKTVDDIEVRGKRVLIRLDLDVPINDEGEITDDRRLRAAVPTVRTVLDGGGRAVLLGHMARPGSDAASKAIFTLFPVANRLTELLKREVRFVKDCVGKPASDAAAALRDGEVCLLENARFHKAEQIKDKEAAKDEALRKEKDDFARQLAALGDVYVNDAFATCHRDNASMLTVPQMMQGKPRVVGYNLQKELEFLGSALREPKRPFVCVLGGAKVSTKLGVITSLLDKCDCVLIGGAMAYTFLAADGVEVGKSLVESDLIETAREIRAKAGDRLRLPVDSIAAAEIKEDASTTVCDGAIAAGMMGLDIGPKTVAAYSDVIAKAATIVWNGPMGVFETPPFDAGTLAMAKVVANATENGAVSIIGGGDSAAAIDKAGLADAMTHISTGGGASLELLEGKRFAALEVLDDA